MKRNPSVCKPGLIASDFETDLESLYRYHGSESRMEALLPNVSNEVLESRGHIDFTYTCFAFEMIVQPLTARNASMESNILDVQNSIGEMTLQIQKLSEKDTLPHWIIALTICHTVLLGIIVVFVICVW